MCPAVPRTSGGVSPGRGGAIGAEAYRRRSEDSADRRLGTRVVERARVEQQPALARASDRPAGRRRAGGAPARRAPARPGRPRTPAPRARAAAARRRPRARARGSRGVDAAGARRARIASARAASSSSPATSIRSTGTSRSAARRVAVEPQRRLERGQRQLVDPQRARQRVRAAASIAARVPTIKPACGPPSSLSPEKQTTAQPAATERRTGGSSASSGTPVGQRARADVVDHRHAERAQLLDLDLLDEPDRAEVRLVRAHHRAGLGPDRGRVVGEPRAVGGAHLDQPRARLRHHVGDPERPADLHELPARDDQLAPAGERGGGRAARRRRSC